MTAGPAGRYIVAGVDHSPGARCAAEWAAYEAASRRLSVHLLHALEPGTDDRGRAAEELLDDVARQLRRHHPAVTVTTGIVPGPATSALVFAAGGGAELLVTGCRGYAAASGMPPGSVTCALAARSPRPFVVVRDQPTDPDRGDIVLGVGPRQDPAAVRFALRRAARQDSRVFAVRAWQPAGRSCDGSRPRGSEAVDRAQGEDVMRLLDPERGHYPGVRAIVETACDSPAPALLLAAKDAQMLVLGAHGRSGGAPRVGSTVYEMLVHCPVPVAIVPPAG